MAKRRTKHAVRRWYGEVFRVPPKEGGALAYCMFCKQSYWFPDRKRPAWNAVDRAGAALRAHVRKVHPDNCLKFWNPAREAK